MKRLFAAAALIALLWANCAAAQGLQRVPTCGTGSPGPGMSPGYQDTSGNTCVTTTPSATTTQALTTTTITTAGTNYVALSSTQHAKGGWIQNCPTNTSGVLLYINENGTATQTVGGSNTSLSVGQTYTVPAGAQTINVTSNTNGALVCGVGEN